MMALLETILEEIISKPATDINHLPIVDGEDQHQTIGDIKTISQDDLRDIWDWNAGTIETGSTCVHDIVQATAQRQPNALAVCSWDGNWTYAELEDASTRFAHRLVELGVGPEVIVPLCFEKSRWTTVAMLAVMKAGGASIAMDHSQPEERLRAIVKQANLQKVLILASSKNQQLASRLADHTTVIVLDKAHLEELEGRKTIQLPLVRPWNKLYVAFTSGSTGTPKGAIITHANFSSAVQHQQAAHGITSSSRVYDFASYAFDIAWGNTLHALTSGACLCVPSEEERRDNLSDSIHRFQTTVIHLTPSIASILSTKTIQSLKMLVLGGEALPLEDAKRWAQLTTVKNVYGPCECTLDATLADVDPDPNATSFGGIGKGVGAHTWVVRPNDHNSLVPIGSVGELLVEGPLVGAGYLHDTERTKAAFIEDPTWLLRGTRSQSGRCGRLYKTGDLVQYNPDGSLAFVGRKDSQVKIRGQRVELGDLEYHVRTKMASDSGVQGVVAEVVRPRGTDKDILVVFLQISGVHSIENNHAIGEEFQRITSKLNEQLKVLLPVYMIPSCYIPIDNIPMTATGKTDRRQLRALGGEMNLDQFKDLSTSVAQKRQPTTSNERRMQSFWSIVLKINSDEIGADDSFFDLGGDSIQTMKLSQHIRDQGLVLSVVNILQNPKLFEMAKLLQGAGGSLVTQDSVYQPFSLLTEDQRNVKKSLHEFGIRDETVQDILPVTDRQAEDIVNTYSHGRGMLAYRTFDGSGTLDIVKMQKACSDLFSRFDMLHTVFVAYKEAFLQVVLKDCVLDIPVIQTDHASIDEATEELRQSDLKNEQRFGELLTRFTIIHQPVQRKYRLVVRLSHAQYDGISTNMMWNSLTSLYIGGDQYTSSDNEQSFAQYMQVIEQSNTQQAIEYWRHLLKGSELTSLKPPTRHTIAPARTFTISKSIPLATLRSSDFTFATILNGAWAYVLARNLATDDIVLGNVYHGRNEPILQSTFGECISIVPTRVVFHADWTARNLLTAIKTQQIASIPFANLGSRKIIRVCTDWPKWSSFSTIINHQNFERDETKDHSRGTYRSSNGNPIVDLRNVEVSINSHRTKDTMEIGVSFTGNFVQAALAHRLTTELQDTIVSFYEQIDSNLIAPQDLRNFSATLPFSSEGVVSQPLESEEQVALAEQCPASTKEALFTAWEDVFGDRDAKCSAELLSFFELDGDTVDACLLSAHMQRLGYRLSIEEVLANPTKTQLLAALSQQQRSADDKN